MHAWRSAVPRSGPSAHDSASSSARHRRSTVVGSTTRSRLCRRAWRRPTLARSGRRAGSEKRPQWWRRNLPAMTIALQYTNITVNDVDESLPFYRDALGLEVQNDVSSGDHRWVTLGSDAQPGLGIV